MQTANELFSILANEGSLALQRTVEAADTAEALAGYKSLVLYAYNERADLSAVILAARSGIGYAIARASSQPDHPLAGEHLSAIRMLTFNLASFTWPGWNHKTISVGKTEAEIGFDAARCNLQIVIELNGAPVQLSRSHWAVGAHHLAAGRFGNAEAEFQTATACAQDAGRESDALMNEGYRLLACALAAGVPSPHLEPHLADLLVKIAPMEDGAFYSEQIVTAAHYFAQKAVS